jgi:hypothetical protein
LVGIYVSVPSFAVVESVGPSLQVHYALLDVGLENFLPSVLRSFGALMVEVKLRDAHKFMETYPFL